MRAIAESCAYDSGTLNRYCVYGVKTAPSSGHLYRRHISGSESGSCSGAGEIPSLKDLSAEAAASLGDVKKVRVMLYHNIYDSIGVPAYGSRTTTKN